MTSYDLAYAVVFLVGVGLGCGLSCLFVSWKGTVLYSQIETLRKAVDDWKSSYNECVRERRRTLADLRNTEAWLRECPLWTVKEEQDDE